MFYIGLGLIAAFIAFIIFYFLTPETMAIVPAVDVDVVGAAATVENVVEPVPTVDELLTYTGYPPTAWGPSLWKMIHLVGSNFPDDPTEQDKETFLNFINGIAGIIPCPSCKAHFHEMLTGNFKIAPEDLVNRFSAFHWTVRVHNEVNQNTNKPVNCDVDFWLRHYAAMRI